MPERSCDTRSMPNPKRPRDPNERAKLIVDIATGESDEPKAPPSKDPAAVALGQRGASKGGTERAKRLTPARRSEIARRAAETRWAARRAD